MPYTALGEPYQGLRESYWEFKMATFKISSFPINFVGNSLVSTNMDEELKPSSFNIVPSYLAQRIQDMHSGKYNGDL